MLADDRVTMTVERVWPSTTEPIASPRNGLRETYGRDKGANTIWRDVHLVAGTAVRTALLAPDGWIFSTDTRGDFDRLYLRAATLPFSKKRRGALRCADAFSGCGGLSLGVKEACRSFGVSFVPALAVDEDPAALAVYQRNFPGVKRRCRKMEDLVEGSLGDPPTHKEKRLAASTGKVDMAISGPPCQGHSNLNNSTRRDDDRNDLYLKAVRLAEILGADSIIIENVPQVRLDKRNAMKTAKQFLEDKRYNVDEGPVKLVEIGVPQKRQRHILIASRTKNLAVKDIVEKHRTSERSVWWAIEDLEDVKPDENFNRPSRLSADNCRRIDHLFDADGYNLPNEIRPKCHQKEHNYRSMYGRLRRDKPAPTITTGYTSPGQGRYIHPTRRRTLTPHEAARIQFFPDSFDFSPAPTQQSLKKLIGNAAPMKLSYIFALELVV